jgi:amino acid transporter
MKTKKVLSEIVRHGLLILSLFFITLSILNDYNPGMAFLSNRTSVTILRVFCVLGIVGFFVRDSQKEKK